MEGGKASVAVPGCDAVIVNAGQSGYYRTLYAPAQFERIAGRFAAVAPIDQLGLLLDSWALGRTGLQPGSDVLELAAATPLDADPQIWGEIASIFAGIDDYYRDDPSRRSVFRKFAIARLAPVFARTGWNPVPDEPATVAILRTRLMAILGALGDRAVIDEARRRYAALGHGSRGDPGLAAQGHPRRGGPARRRRHLGQAARGRPRREDAARQGEPVLPARVHARTWAWPAALSISP